MSQPNRNQRTNQRPHGGQPVPKNYYDIAHGATASKPPQTPAKPGAEVGAVAPASAHNQPSQSRPRPQGAAPHIPGLQSPPMRTFPHQSQVYGSTNLIPSQTQASYQESRAQGGVSSQAQGSSGGGQHGLMRGTTPVPLNTVFKNTSTVTPTKKGGSSQGGSKGSRSQGGWNATS
ncbi:hypothetical protein C8T65DRAFT_699474 [Cerioporus squamosus]|nr:hypothetical protein C8T65DRAFT_699474 [Cerioporus squamosus]